MERGILSRMNHSGGSVQTGGSPPVTPRYPAAGSGVARFLLNSTVNKTLNLGTRTRETTHMEAKKIGTSEFIDKCTARWLFEKTGVQLYDEAIAKCPPEFK